MSDGAVLDLYADDLEKDFSQQNPDKFTEDGVDLYDDISVPTDASVAETGQAVGDNGTANLPNDGSNSINKGLYQSNAANHAGRKYQLYVGNLTWWTTDQDISNAVRDCGINDFYEVKFFENRANGQSKGFCVVTLGSEASLRLALERLPKKELHSQVPAVTHPTKQALNHFESLQKTRPIPPTQTNCPMRGPAPMNMGVPGAMVSHVQPQGVMPGNPQRMMNPNMPPQQYRPPHMQQDSPIGPNGGPPRMQPPMHQNAMMGPQGQPMPPGPPRYPNNQPQWQNVQGGQPRSNGPRVGPPNGPMARGQMFQGSPGGMGIRGPRPDWNRPPMHANYGPHGPPGVSPQGSPHMQGPPRGPGGQPNMVGPPTGGPGGVPNPHVNPAFFNQSVGGPAPHPLGPPMQGPHGPRVGMIAQHATAAHFQQGNPPRGPWPVAPQVGKPQISFPEVSSLNEAEFEDVMSRNRTVSSSAIARAVSDAATGEYSSAIETLATAISLIKQSKVSHDERCKILISSLQDTLHGIEAKSYNRREHSRSRERTHRTRPRRDRSTSRYRERSRERERDRERDRGEREGGSYRERSRSRERPDHYRDDSSSRSTRPRKSPEAVERSSDPAPSKRGYYEERYRSSDRERERDRGDRSRRDRDQDRDRDERERERRH